MRDVKTEVLVVDAAEPDPSAIQAAAAVIREGGLVVVPTDSVYGIVCDPSQPKAVDSIYRVKRRQRELPLVLLLHNTAQVSSLIEEVPESAVVAMQHFWPGALTVVVRDRGAATAAVRARRDSVGLRLPAHMVPRLVAEAAGCALASTSANRSGRPSPATVQEALAEVSGLVPLALDAGPAPLGRESTVVDFTREPPRVLRFGAIPVTRLREVLGEVREQ